MPDHLAALEREVRRVADLTATADLDALTPSCPGWTVRDLVGHLGGVHRWATEALGAAPDAAPRGEHDPPVGLDGVDLAVWVVAGADRLVNAVRSGESDRACWTFGPPHTAAFWVRRQAHETTVHRWDLELAVASPSRIGDDQAIDGIDEVVSVLLPRQVRLRRIAAGPEWIELDIGGRRIAVTAGPQVARRPVATVSGDPHDLLLMLWGRGDGAGLSVDGDRAALARFVEGNLTP